MTTKVLPVIHYLSVQQALDNAALAKRCGCPGVFLISMDGRDDELDQAIMAVKYRNPDLYVGANFLSQTPLKALHRSLELGIQATWVDYAGVSGFGPNQQALDIAKVLDANPGHDFFGAVAFKYQPVEKFPVEAAIVAAKQGMIATTSGAKTGHAPDPAKLRGMREGLNRAFASANYRPALALASGVTPENAHQYLDSTTHFLVSKGISESEHQFSEEKLRALMAVVNSASVAVHV